MRTLKDFLEKKEPSNYKEIAKMIMDEYKATLPKTTHNTDISGSLTISDELLNTLKANLVGFGPAYSGTKVENIIKARLVTWQAGGTGVSPQTFIKLSEQARALRYQTEIPKDNAYTNTAIPASHLLDQFLRHSDYYADLPDTDIKAFISGSFIQLGVATELVSMLSNIWLNFCFNSANTIAISGITLDKTNPMGPASAELVALKNLASKNDADSEPQKQDALQSTVPALKILGLIDFINDINVTAETAASADLHYYLHGISEIPEQLYATFTGIWSHLEVLDRCLSANTNNAAELSLSVLKVIEHMHDILKTIVNRTRTLLSGRIEDVSKDVILGSRDMGLSNIVEVLDSIAIKAATNQKYSVEELEAMLSIDDNEKQSSDGTLTINILAGLLEDVRIAIMVERFAHIYIAERVPAVNNRLRKMREDSDLPESSVLYKDFFKALPVRITDKGLAAYIDDRSYDFGGNFGPSVFHNYSILNILGEHEPNDSTTDVPSTNTGVGIINKWIYDHKEQGGVANEAKDAFSETKNESKGLLHDTEKALVGNETFTGAKDSFDNKDDAVGQGIANTDFAGKSDDSQSVYDTFDGYLNKLKEQTTRIKMASMMGDAAEIDPKELILEAKAALEIAIDMLTGTSGGIMKQLLGEVIVNTISAIVNETREVISIAEFRGVYTPTLKQAASKITAVFMDATGKMADLKEKSFALNRVVHNLECFVFAANNAIDENGEFNVHEYKAVDHAHEQLEVLGLSGKDWYFDTSKDIDAIIDEVRSLIVKIKASINEDNIRDSQILIADMKDVSTAIKDHYFAIRAAASSAFNDNFVDDKDEPVVSSIDTKETAVDDSEQSLDDSDSPLMSVNDAKDNLTCFIWAVELASKDGFFDISKYQGIDHASDQIPFNAAMSGDDASEDDEVRDLVRNFLRITRSLSTQNETQSASDRSPACEEMYIRDATIALTSCRVLVHDRAKVHGRSFGDIHATIRADRPTDLFSISAYKIDLGSAEMKPNLAINPLEVSVDLSRERNLLVSELPTSLLRDIELDFGFDDHSFLEFDFDEEPLEFYDDPLEFDDESEFNEATVVGELRRLMALEAGNNPKKGDM